MKVEPTVYVRLLFGALVSISSFLRSPQRHWPTMLLNITVKLEPELPHFKVIKNTQLKPLLTFFQFKDSSWTARDISPSISKAIDCLSYGNREVSFLLDLPMARAVLRKIAFHFAIGQKRLLLLNWFVATVPSWWYVFNNLHIKLELAIWKLDQSTQGLWNVEIWRGITSRTLFLNLGGLTQDHTALHSTDSRF